MSTQRPVADSDIQALLAFLGTLKPPHSPSLRKDGSLKPRAARGKSLFEEKAGCTSCHHGPHFTSPDTFEVGLESNRYFYPAFNPPSLRGVRTRRRFLHDGRALTLREVLTRHHRPERLAGQHLSEAELQDLIAYLESL